MNNPWIQFAIILILIVANGAFSLSEIALVSARKGRLKQKADDGDRSAQAVLKLQEHPNRFLSTVQIGISSIGILSGALGSATLATSISSLFENWGIDPTYSQEAAFIIVVIITTYLSLILGELIPKRLGMNNPEKIAQKIAPTMDVISRLAAPLVKFLGWSTEAGIKLLGIKVSDEPEISEEEIRMMLMEGTAVGVFDVSEHDMMEGVFRLGDRRIDMIVTPRTELEWLNLEDPIEEWDRVVFSTKYNQLPVIEGELDDVVGVIRTRDLLRKRITGESFDPRSLILPVAFIPESMPAIDALQLIKKTASNMAMVIDEFGGLLGIVTLYDVMEAIIGDMSNGDYDEEGSVVEREDGSWLVDGLLAVDELKLLLDVNALDGEIEFGFQTMGGFVMAQLGRIPKPGQSFSFSGFQFEVVDMDGRRVDKVLITRVPIIDDEAATSNTNQKSMGSIEDLGE